jgi:hypothetical protein
LHIDLQGTRRRAASAPNRRQPRQSTREGKTLIVRIAEPDEIQALHAVVTGGRYELTVETMQPCQPDYVGGDDMLRCLKDHADAALHATPLARSAMELGASGRL